MEESIREKESLLSIIEESFGKGATAVNAMSPLTLAFLGDSVYSVVIRTIVVNQGNTANKKLHQKTSDMVSAVSQAKMADVWKEKELLTETEQDIYRRGQNAKPHSLAKNAKASDYHKATGVEALAGYLYLTDNMPRLLELIKQGFELGA